jgi:hypothetical protein
MTNPDEGSAAHCPLLTLGRWNRMSRCLDPIQVLGVRVDQAT